MREGHTGMCRYGLVDFNWGFVRGTTGTTKRRNDGNRRNADGRGQDRDGRGDDGRPGRAHNNLQSSRHLERHSFSFETAASMSPVLSTPSTGRHNWSYLCRAALACGPSRDRWSIRTTNPGCTLIVYAHDGLISFGRSNMIAR